MFCRNPCLFLSSPVSRYLSPDVRESMTVLDSGFHDMDSGFQHSGFRIPKRAGFQIFFSVLILFFAFRFRVRILLYWKTLLEYITSLFSFSIYKLREEMYYSSVITSKLLRRKAWFLNIYLDIVLRSLFNFYWNHWHRVKT